MNWNIGTYESSFQQQLLRESVDYLQSLLRPFDSDYRVHTFKAGYWGLQPFEYLQRHLQDVGIKILIGVKKGLHVPTLAIDYRHLEEDTLPYHPDLGDVRKVADQRNNLIILPLACYSPNLAAWGKLAVNLALKKLVAGDRGASFGTNDRNEKGTSPGHPAKKSKLSLSWRPYVTHLKMGDQPFSYLKSSFDAVIRRFRRYDIDRLPVVIESHSKQHIYNYANIQKFLTYVVEKYENEVEFLDLTSFLRVVEAHPEMVRIHHEP